ncbi:MAG: hypothetical protein RR888_02130 [Akkermansia sp.]
MLRMVSFSAILPFLLGFVLLLGSCSWRSKSFSAISITKCQEAQTSTSPIIIDGILISEKEWASWKVTPIDEYFATLGKPSRAVPDFRIQFDQSSPLTQTLSLKRIFNTHSEKADYLLLQVSLKKRPSTRRETRRLLIPLPSKVFPQGTKTIPIYLYPWGLHPALSWDLKTPEYPFHF